MTREERLNNKINALKTLLLNDLIASDRLYYENRLVQVQAQLEKVQPTESLQPTSSELLEEYNLGCDSCRWTENEIRKVGLPPETVIMLKAVLNNMQPYLEKIKDKFLGLFDASAWLPETRAEKQSVRDQLFALDMEHDGLVSLLELQQLQLDRHGKTDFLTLQLKQNLLELEKLELRIESLKQQLHS
jgi:hypothetical protein